MMRRWLWAQRASLFLVSSLCTTYFIKVDLPDPGFPETQNVPAAVPLREPSPKSFLSFRSLPVLSQGPVECFFVSLEDVVVPEVESLERQALENLLLVGHVARCYGELRHLHFETLHIIVIKADSGCFGYNLPLLQAVQDRLDLLSVARYAGSGEGSRTKKATVAKHGTYLDMLQSSSVKAVWVRWRRASTSFNSGSLNKALRAPRRLFASRSSELSSGSTLRASFSFPKIPSIAAQSAWQACASVRMQHKSGGTDSPRGLDVSFHR
ncbi:hypothetical protein PG987_014584 [Apiospora arundinis]